MPAPLPTLRAKLSRRKKGRKRQLRLFRKTKKKGHRKQAGKHGRAARRLVELIEKVVALLKEKPKSGTGAWGGSKSIIVNEVMPVAKEWGIPSTSQKRWETYGNPGSDHYRGNKTAFAVDFATDSNYAFGIAIGRALKVPYTGAADDYRSFYITRAGQRFRVQIICGTHGTGPHTHVGVKRA